MKQGLQLRTTQSLKMSPKLQQAINLLQLSSAELELELSSALESNPMLEVVEPQDETFELPVNTLWSDVEADYNYLSSFNNSEDFNHEEKSNAETSLGDYLRWQLNLTPFSDPDRTIAITLIDSINEDGYLMASLEEIQLGLQHNHPNYIAEFDLDNLEAVLHRIQQFDPLGVASRTLQECMLIQLNGMTENNKYLAAAKILVAQHLELLAKKNYQRIKSELVLNDNELQEVLSIVTHLQPHPGQIILSAKSDYIIPDVMVTKENQQWVVGLNKDLTTNLRINSSYVALIKRADNSRDNQYLRDQLSEAQWILNGVKTRNETLLKVAGCIVKYQREFLEHGEEKMRPLILQDVAQQVGLNESTISRVTSKKYMHTPRGIYELKYFFSSHISNSINQQCSSTAVKAIIKQLISKEDNAARLTDQEITDIMIQRGLKIARRTVAKYREALGIQSSNQR